MIVLPPAIDLQAYLALQAKPISALGLSCDACSADRLHAHGGYVRKAFVTREGGVRALPIRRVRCTECDRAPSVVPAFAASGLQAEDAAVEDAAAHYLISPEATYRGVAAGRGVAHTTLWRWVGRLGQGALAAMLAMLVVARPDVDPLTWLPKLVPVAERKARTPARRRILLDALQVLTAARRLAEVSFAGMAIRRPPTLRFALASHMRRNTL